MSVPTPQALGQKPELFVLDKLELLVSNSKTLETLYPEAKITHVEKTEASPYRIALGAAFAALSAIAYKQLYTRTAIAFAAVALGTFYFMKVPNIYETEDFKAQCAKIKELTAGIIEGLNFYTKVKQKALIDRLNVLDLNGQKDPLQFAQDELNSLAKKYDAEDSFGSENDIMYTQLLPIAKEVLKIDLDQAPHLEKVPALLRKEWNKIRLAALHFIHGYHKTTNEKPEHALGYLQVELNQGKIAAKSWVKLS